MKCFYSIIIIIITSCNDSNKSQIINTESTNKCISKGVIRSVKVRSVFLDIYNIVVYIDILEGENYIRQKKIFKNQDVLFSRRYAIGDSLYVCHYCNEWEIFDLHHFYRIKRHESHTEYHYEDLDSTFCK